MNKMGFLPILSVVFATLMVDANDGFPMFFKNPSARLVQLVWVSPDGDEHTIDNIAAAGEMRVNTFHGHTFGWRTVGTSDALRQFEIKSEMADTYYTLPGMTAPVQTCASAVTVNLILGDESLCDDICRQTKTQWTKAKQLFEGTGVEFTSHRNKTGFHRAAELSISYAAAVLRVR